jgi:hypothetical protein
MNHYRKTQPEKNKEWVVFKRVGYPWHYLKSYNEKVAMEDGNNPFF